MQEQINAIVQEALRALENAKNSEQLEQVRVKLLGRKGEITQMLRKMGEMSAEERPKLGQIINRAREKVEESLKARQEIIARAEKAERFEKEAIDISMPGRRPPIGVPHPLTITQERMITIFTGMGFSVEDGPEIEWDRYNFELMNLPKNHPARDAQDTFYINDNVVLRTHTSPVQARVMTTQKPPIRIICPGRTYRVDEMDATHSPMFSQCEGLVIDKKVSMSDLKGTLDVFAREMYGEGISTRFRPSFFPFTEPSAEVDVTCSVCKGAGCRNCKGTGWIEILGGGMVNPKVLTMCGIDPEVYSGFAFGIGIERVSMLRYNIGDMRTLYENDMRFLSQFLQEKEG